MDALSEAIPTTAAGANWPDVERVFRAHYARLARIIARVVRDHARAEELAVEVCLKWSEIRKGQVEDAERWLYRAAVRAGLNELRRQARASRYERLFTLFRKSPTPEELLAANQEHEHVRRLLAAMPARQAELLLLRAEGLSYGELAQALNLNPASVGTLLSRAQQSFRKEYVRRYEPQSHR